MNEKFSGKVWVLGDDIDTDIIIPTEYLALKTVEDMKPYAFSPLRPELAGQIKPGDIIVAGKNFGCGSSREQEQRHGDRRNRYSARHGATARRPPVPKLRRGYGYSSAPLHPALGSAAAAPAKIFLPLPDPAPHKAHPTAALEVSRSWSPPGKATAVPHRTKRQWCAPSATPNGRMRHTLPPAALRQHRPARHAPVRTPAPAAHCP